LRRQKTNSKVWMRVWVWVCVREAHVHACCMGGGGWGTAKGERGSA